VVVIVAAAHPATDKGVASGIAVAQTRSKLSL
jgi:hypothetical protein